MIDDPFEHVKNLTEGISPSVNENEKEILSKLLNEYADVFSKGEFDLGNTSITQHRINTGDSPPIKDPLRRQPYAMVPEIEKQVQQMLSAGVIEPSCSPWASNVVMVKKNDGTMRFCIDYRKLNAVTKKDCYPLPRIDVCLDTLNNSQLFSAFDLRSGYHQVQMHPR